MDLKISIEGLDKFSNLVDTQAYKKAQWRTTKEIGSSIRTKAVKEVRKTYNIKASYLKKYINNRLEKSGDEYSWVFTVQGKVLNLYHFGAKQNEKGVSVKVRKDEGRKTIAGGFIWNGQVFKRVRRTRLPIKALRTLSAPQMFNDEIVSTALEGVGEKYVKKFEHNLLYYLEK